MDIWGREADLDGVPWVEKFRRGELRWEKPSTTVPHDFGYYLYPARKQGMRTASAKTVIKARFIYYPELPGGYHAASQPDPGHDAGRVGRSEGAPSGGRRRSHRCLRSYAKEQAIFRVLDAGVDTLVVASAQPIYSDFEELSGSFVGVHKAVEQWRKGHGGKRIKIVIPPYMASQQSFDRLVLGNFAGSVPPASAPGQAAMGILTLHGLPVSLLGSDSWSGRVAEISRRLVPQAEAILRAKGYARVEVHLAPEGFGDTLEDPDNKQTSVHELYRRAEREGFAVAVASPLEFMAENSDSLFAHSALMFDRFPGYSTYMGPPPGTDWAKPYVRRFQLGKTTAIYGGAPGGATVPQQSAALAEAISAVFGK